MESAMKLIKGTLRLFVEIWASEIKSEPLRFPGTGLRWRSWKVVAQSWKGWRPCSLGR